MLQFLIALLASGLTTLLIVRFAKRLDRLRTDRDFGKPQKFHVSPVPRIGGLGILAGVAAAIGIAGWNWTESSVAALLMVCSLPVFLLGLVQDFSDAIAPSIRLLAAVVSAGLAFWLVDAALVRTAIPGLDWIAASVLGSLLLTILAVTGIAHAMNIIDGFNGLASMCAVLMLTAIGYVAYQVDDRLIALLALAGIGSVLGFFLWNYPAGLIFLGDGGAYFLGFLIAELGILLLYRNPGEVSPLFPLLVCIYPAFETLFSMYRRVFLRAVPASMPDGIHLHSLVYRRLLRWAVGDRSARALTRRNSLTAPYLWVLCMLSLVPAVLFWSDDLLLGLSLLLFGFSYVFLYWRIVRFRSPRWLRLKLPAAGSPGDHNTGSSR